MELKSQGMACNASRSDTDRNHVAHVAPPHRVLGFGVSRHRIGHAWPGRLVAPRDRLRQDDRRTRRVARLERLKITERPLAAHNMTSGRVIPHAAFVRRVVEVRRAMAPQRRPDYLGPRSTSSHQPARKHRRRGRSWLRRGTCLSASSRPAGHRPDRKGCSSRDAR
jgi:hypothetical protein